MQSAFNDLVQETSAEKWAHEFVKVAEIRPDIPHDEGTMVCWFANAIMAGYDEGVKNERSRGVVSIIREIAYQSAGAGAGAVMEEAPNVVMPDQEIMTRVTMILNEFGIRTNGRSDDRCDPGRDVVAGSDDAYVEQAEAYQGSDQTSSSWRREENARRKAMGLEAEPDRVLREHRKMVAE